MAMCEKCGAHLEEGMKYCDKCGSDVTGQSSGNILADELKSLDNEEVQQNSGLGIITQIENAVLTYLPHPFTKFGDRTSLMIGLGSLAVLALTYLVCFFSFMAEMCLPVGLGIISDVMGSLSIGGASPVWIILHFVFNLFPIYFVVKAFLNKEYRLYAIFVAAFILVLTLFSIISWALCEPSDYMEALSVYTDSPGSIAWFSFVDSLSEAWYLKILFSLGAIFGFGVDYIINRGN